MSLPVPSWDELFMRDVYHIARKSKDPRSKIGAVLVYWEKKDPFSRGYNDFPRKVKDRLPHRWERPEKYFWVKHAEENAILNCARTGRATEGATMFTQGIPCSNCSGDIIQADIVEIVVHSQWQYWEKEFNWAKWGESCKRSEEMLAEAGVKIRVFDQELGLEALLDGKIIKV
jgi:dCMP deaminase